MDARTESEPARMKNLPTMERKSERELVVTRTVNGPQRLVFEACTNPELFLRWWVPRSAGISVLSHEMDIRTGGKYRLVFAHSPQPMEFFGRYIEVTPHSRIVWSNDEPHGGGAVTTMTLEDKGDQTLLVISDRYPTKEALDGALASGASDAMPEQLDQLDELLATMRADVRRT